MSFSVITFGLIWPTAFGLSHGIGVNPRGNEDMTMRGIESFPRSSLLDLANNLHQEAEQLTKAVQSGDNVAQTTSPDDLDSQNNKVQQNQAKKVINEQLKVQEKELEDVMKTLTLELTTAKTELEAITSKVNYQYALNVNVSATNYLLMEQIELYDMIQAKSIAITDTATALKTAQEKAVTQAQRIQLSNADQYQIAWNMAADDALSPVEVTESQDMFTNPDSLTSFYSGLYDNSNPVDTRFGNTLFGTGQGISAQNSTQQMQDDQQRQESFDGIKSPSSVNEPSSSGGTTSNGVYYPPSGTSNT